MSKKVLGLGLVLLFLAWGWVTEVKATSSYYELTFFDQYGVQTGSGSFWFDAGSNTNTQIGAPATLTNLSATINAYNYQGTGPDNDFVYVDDAGLITWVHADLLNSFPGIKLQLNEDLTFACTLALFQPYHGTYTVVDPDCPIPVPGTLILVGSGIAGLWVWRRRRG